MSTTWFYPIDWSATISAGSALTAVAALCWNVVYSQRRERRLALASIAANRVPWVEELRLIAADISVLYTHVLVLRSRGEREENHDSLMREFYEKVARAELMVSDQDDDNHKEFLQLLFRLHENVNYSITEGASETELEQAKSKLANDNELFRKATRKILRQEWKRIKNELRGVEVQNDFPN